MGGNLTQADDWIISLLTNPEIIAVDQHSRANRPVITTDNIIVWTARPESGTDIYVAVFNIGEANQDVKLQWQELGLTSTRYRLRDLWERTDVGTKSALEISLSEHASKLFRLSFVQR